MPFGISTPLERDQSALIDVGVVAAMLSCSVRHVWRLHDRGVIPRAVYLGSLRRWNRRAVEQWLADGCRPVCQKEAGYGAYHYRRSYFPN